jgi:hypothetical protein
LSLQVSRDIFHFPFRNQAKKVFFASGANNQTELQTNNHAWSFLHLDHNQN